MPFTNSAWSSPEANLSADDFCSLCLIDLNEPGAAKVKGQCKLPIKSTPGGPYNQNAMMAAANALSGARGGVDAPQPDKLKAARKLMRLMAEAGMSVHQGLQRMMGG